MKEILSLQFGSYSNGIGSHFWNFQADNHDASSFTDESQDECDPRYLYRCGKTEKGASTFTPRLMVFDAKGSLGSLRRGGYLYHQDAYENPKAASSQAPGGKTLQVFQEDAYPQNQFIDENEGSSDAPSTQFNKSERDILLWTDYLKAHYHPRSVFELPEYRAFESFHNYFEGSWGAGKIKLETSEEAWERVRQYLEECDNLQGVNCLVDLDSGWSGFATDMLRELKEECRSATIICYGNDHVYQSTEPTLIIDEAKVQSRSSVNLALALAQLTEYASMFVPLASTFQNTSFPHFQMDRSKLYHTTAIASTALEIMTSPCRLRKHGMRYSNLVARMDLATSPVVELSTIFPVDKQVDRVLGHDGSPSHIESTFQSGSLLPKRLDKKQIASLVSSPGIYKPEYHAECIAFRGVNFHGFNKRDESIRAYLAQGPYLKWGYSVVDASIVVPSTFPEIISGMDVNAQGLRILSGATQLSTSSRCGEYLKHVAKQANAISTRIVHEYAHFGMHPDDLKAAHNRLLTLSDEYTQCS